ncbi:hypothetical protein [Paracoccus sp. S3-43]|uniref:hypothetical protein n=1 Tax=Paracoccus sp. S3-43 TaxID=3030011 RepID=UPI0023B0121C|nr:hypothetical protein [Paracoccus sp. S3-43]WEF25142.1 hypothetical protein PXD02_04140 [Paracoccus sp. S3-43]
MSSSYYGGDWATFQNGNNLVIGVASQISAGNLSTAATVKDFFLAGANTVEYLVVGADTRDLTVLL